jgi:hypothetical protein
MSKAKKPLFKKAIGAKTDAVVEETERKIYRDGHKFFTAPEAKAIYETVTKENTLRENYYKSKIYLKRDRNPLNGEYTPRHEQESNISEIMSEERQEWFCPEVPKADESNYEKDRTKRQIERNVQLRKVRNNYDAKLEALRQMYADRAQDVEQSLLRNRLSNH